MTIRRVIRRALLTIPLAVWLAANLWLESPPGRHLIAARIHRIIGDNLAFLGNATLLADGRLAAAIRMVAPPETATTISQYAFPNSQPPPPLTPLATPQRAALDLEAFGIIGRLSLRLGRDGPVISDQ